ncbi:hypothetical protein ACPA9J_24075 [Pseudomonas aeruginosa]
MEGKTYETGIKGELADGRLNLSLAAFRIDLENNPQEDPDHPGPPNNPFLHQRRQGAQPGLRAGRHRLPDALLESLGRPHLHQHRVPQGQPERPGRATPPSPRGTCCACGVTTTCPGRIGAGASVADSRRRATTASTTAA